MIRTPQAKQQAEILIAELNRRGTKLPWSHALEIVARMQGFRGWNTLCAAASAAQKAPAVAPDKQPPGSYLVPGIEALAHNGHITDARLAAFLGHCHRDQSTTLLVWTAPDGQEYELRLCGLVWFDYRQPDGTLVSVHSSDGLPAFDRMTAETQQVPQELHTQHNSPFFEWLNANSDPVGDVFETISANPQDEIASLQRMLG